uniref:NEDD8-activating enzyme E1 catalytic subunit n=1 Tax=Plectus sambesii TaxID=2011161 RepID=A0A914XMC3_9BILA
MANTASVDWPERWAHISKLLERGSKMAHPDFEPGPDNLKGVNQCKILVVGAGGLGCELLKDLALSGFQNIHVIDMDTIDLSNLNRQFLFRLKDVGSFKAEVAARIVSQRVPGCNVVAHNCKIQDKNDDFYRSFNLIVCGLDSIVARRWLNGMIVSYLTTSPDFQMKSPSVTAPGKTLYMASAVIPALEELSRKNLRLSLKELGLADGHEIAVADETLSQPLTFRLQLTAPAMDVTQ